MPSAPIVTANSSLFQSATVPLIVHTATVGTSALGSGVGLVSPPGLPPGHVSLISNWPLQPLSTQTPRLSNAQFTLATQTPAEVSLTRTALPWVSTAQYL